jgi:predicted HicB family RNase H-like nuclease
MANQRAENKKGIGVYVEKTLHAQLVAIAKRRGITLKQLVEEAAVSAVEKDQQTLTR